MSSSPPQNEEDEADRGRRRGARARKVVERFAPGRARAADKSKALDDLEDLDEEDQNDDDEEDEHDSDEEAQRRPQKKRPPNGIQRGKADGTGGKGKAKVTGNGTAGPVIEGTDGPKTDCPLFNALLSPDIALLPLIDDWIESYQESCYDQEVEQGYAHELVTLCIRSCGLSADIELDEAVDADGAGDVLERIQDDIVQTSLAAYPLISKAKIFRSFRTNLSVFIHHFITTMALSPCLYDTDVVDSAQHTWPIVPLVFNWLHLMSSSPLRPIRHTSTYLVLKLNTALCDVAAGVSKDLSIKQRLRETEAKKAGTGAAAQKRLKDADARVTEEQDRKTRLSEYMQETFDVMFVHRVRDADPAIRTDCLRELGIWVKKYPERYLATAYLTYFTRGCNDPNAHARFETVKALLGLFSNDNFINNARTVALRLIPRLVEMALRDVDLPVRITALSVIAITDKTGILQDEHEEQREKVARLIFDHEPRVRKAVSAFFLGVWEERTEKLKAQWRSSRSTKKKRGVGITEEEMEAIIGWKSLAALLVETAKSLEMPKDGASTWRQPQPLLRTGQTVTHANAAVEAIWAEFGTLQEWQKLVEYLLLDHSTAAQDMWLLKDEEEDFMIQVLIACVKQEHKEDELDPRTKTLMQILPRLFTKHQSDTARMAGILSIPEHMELALYLDMRKSAAYDSLWDDVTKQFLQHTESTVLSAAIQAINHLSTNSSMAGSNGSKLAELEEALFTSLRDSIDGEDVFTMSLDEDRLANLEGVLLRINLLGRSRDLVGVMEDEEGGQSSGWEIICAFANRGDVGYKEEAQMVEYALQIVFVHISWLFKRFSPPNTEDGGMTAALTEKRNRAIEIFQNLSLRERSNAAPSVRRQAFLSFINTHVLFSNRSEAAAAKACPLEMADEIQHRLGGAFQAVVERYASDSEEDGVETAEPGQVMDGPVVQKGQHELRFLQIVSVFVGAVRCGILEVDHAKEPLAHFGRFGPSYDAVVKKLVDVLRDEGIYNKAADTVQHVAGSAIQMSFNTFLDSDDEEPHATIALAKLIGSAFIIHGTHFSILKQIHPSDVYDLHITSLEYVARRISVLVKQEKAAKVKDAKNRAMRKRYQALSFFRVLMHLLGPVTGKDALRIKSHLEEAIKSTEAPISVNKNWDSYRMYERKLVTLASRDPNVKMASKRMVAEADDTDEPLISASVPIPKRSIREPVLYGDDLGNEEGGNPAATRTKKKQSARRPIADERDLDENEEDEEDLADPHDSARSRSSPESAKRSLPIEDDSGFQPMSDVDLNLDMDFELDLPGSQDTARARSVSIEPTAKKRRTVRRF